jgi:uncharacterized membrane protein HdeD (DUF308 family)
MLDLLGRNWWVLAIRGVIAIAFGMLAFIQPKSALGVLVTLVALYLIADGVSLVATYVRGDPEARRAGWSVAVMGILGIVIGVAAFAWPNATALSIVMGAVQLVAAIRLRREINGELFLAIGGVLAIAFGVYLVTNPSDGLMSLVWLVGFWAVLFGAVTVVLAYRLRSVVGTIPQRAAT